MAGGISIEIMNRLWTLLSLMIKKKRRSELAVLMGYSSNALSADLFKLRKMGLDIKHSRKTDTYTIQFPQKDEISLKLTKEEFFYVLNIMNNVTKTINLPLISQKLESALSDEADPIFDCGPAYGIGSSITSGIAPLINALSEAIYNKNKVVIVYNKLDGKSDMRVIYPYKLIHSPTSWYVLAYCEDKCDFRKFKLARIESIKPLNDKFKKIPFNIKEYLGDAWWIQYDEKRLNTPYPIKILFKNEAASAIKEYNFHKTQQLTNRPEGTMAQWKLSYLNEFASWLMQWLPNIEIQEPQELKDMIEKKIKKYK